jgi:hypothetical protein
MPQRAAVCAILTGGAAAGTLDILAACTVYALRGVAPVRILQSIASGLLGAAAFQGGAATAALGLVLHFFIATTAAAVYYVASRVRPALVQRAALFGTLYGIGVYLVMTFVVLPLSALSRRPFAWDMAVIMVIVHIVCVGLPIAFAVRRCTRGPS